MGSAQTEHLGAYCLEGSKAVQVGMWGEAPCFHQSTGRADGGGMATGRLLCPSFPHLKVEEAQQKGLRPATRLSQNPTRPKPTTTRSSPITSILQKAHPEEP